MNRDKTELRINKTKLTIVVIAISLISAAFLSLRSPRKETLPQPSVKPVVTSEAESVKKTKSSAINTKVLDSTTDNSTAKSRTDGLVIEEDLEFLSNEPGFYAEPWKRKLDEYENLINVSIKQIDEPGNYTLNFNPIANRSYRYVSFTSSLMGSNKEPIMKLVKENRLVTKLNEKGELLIEREHEKSWGLSTGAEIPQIFSRPAKDQFLVQDGDLYQLQQNDSRQQIENLPINGGDIQQFKFNLPKEGTLQVGKSWTVVNRGPVPSVVTHKLVGFANVAGAITAKFVSESESSIDSEVLNKMATAISANKMDMANAMVSKYAYEKGISEDAALSRIKRAMAQHPQKGIIEPMKPKGMTVTYVELGTGLVVRMEDEVTIEAGGFQTKTITISQRLQGEK